MKTVSTKLDQKDFEEFQECCERDGRCSSEYLRDLIKMDIEAWKDEDALVEEDETVVSEESEPEKTSVMAHGKILDDFGNVIGTF